MDSPAFLFEQAVVNDFLCQGVLENVFQIRLKGSGADQIEALQTAQALVCMVF